MPVFDIAEQKIMEEQDVNSFSWRRCPIPPALEVIFKYLKKYIFMLQLSNLEKLELYYMWLIQAVQRP